MSRLLVVFLFFSCSQNNFQKIDETYDGPIIEIKDLNTFFSDSAKVKFKLKAKLYQVFGSGEEKYPDGLDMDIFSNQNPESISATFQANHVIKYEDENYFKATGNVILYNLETNDELRTEELFWYPNDEKFISEKFVTIRTGNEVHKGEGMVSNQDFSNYEILKPSGIIEIDEN
tara:strand:- start:120 stop:641 length:522 start_codon:yes stop_codon:yes gene_type:complete